MGNPVCIEFARQHLCRDDIEGKAVIEVGSMNFNGTVRNVIEKLKPSSYLGVDMTRGPGVDQSCSVENLARRYGTENFDVVMATEMLEHVRDWRAAISNLKSVLRPNGVLLVTTRSKGFPYHGFPYDFWRYEMSDMVGICSALSMEIIEKDPQAHGVFVKVRKPLKFAEDNLKGYELFSIVRHDRCADINNREVFFLGIPHLLAQTMSRRAKKTLRNLRRMK